MYILNVYVYTHTHMIHPQARMREDAETMATWPVYGTASSSEFALYKCTRASVRIVYMRVF